MKLFGKKIDRKWFENYWYYYKIHTFAGLFVLLIITYTAVECANNIEPDVAVSYIGGTYFDSDFADSFEQRLSQYIDDINNDGVLRVQFSPMFASSEIKTEQDFAMQQKIQLEIAVGDSFLFLLDKEYYDLYVEQNLFIDLSPHIGGDKPVFGLKASDSPILREMGIDENSQIFAAVRVLTQGDEKKQKKTASQGNAINILKELYKND